MKSLCVLAPLLEGLLPLNPRASTRVAIPESKNAWSLLLSKTKFNSTLKCSKVSHTCKLLRLSFAFAQRVSNFSKIEAEGTASSHESFMV